MPRATNGYEEVALTNNMKEAPTPHIKEEKFLAQQCDEKKGSIGVICHRCQEKGHFSYE